MRLDLFQGIHFKLQYEYIYKLFTQLFWSVEQNIVLGKFFSKCILRSVKQNSFSRAI